MRDLIILLMILIFSAGVMRCIKEKRCIKRNCEHWSVGSREEHTYHKYSAMLQVTSKLSESDKGLTYHKDSVMPQVTGKLPASKKEHTCCRCLVVPAAHKDWTTLKKISKWRHYAQYSKKLRIRLKYQKRLEAQNNARKQRTL